MTGAPGPGKRVSECDLAGGGRAAEQNTSCPLKVDYSSWLKQK